MIILIGCKGRKALPEPNPHKPKTLPVVQHGLDTIRYWYYWSAEIPNQLPTENYANLKDLLLAVAHPKDRYSNVYDLEYIKTLFNGTPTDFGFGGEAFDKFGSLIIGYVYDGSPAGMAGLKRGTKILAINDKVPTDYGKNLATILNQPTLDFLVEFPNHTTKKIKLTKSNYKINPILHYSVIEQEGKSIGYLVLNSFIGVDNQELNTVFAYFKSREVRDLIVDLRYNGGGYLKTVNYLANLVFPAQYENYAFVRSRFNATRQMEYGKNAVSYFLRRQPNSLNIRDLVVITTSNSASGSEVLINNLRPYMTVKTVGTRTYGKPTFNRLYEFGKQSLYLTLGITANVQGNADYFEGIPADGFADDDQTKVFGNIEESSLKEALHYMKYHHFSGQTGRTQRKNYVKKPFIF